MTRIDFRPWAGLALSVAVLGYVGCSSSSPTEFLAGVPGREQVGRPRARGARAAPDAAGGTDRSSWPTWATRRRC